MRIAPHFKSNISNFELDTLDATADVIYGVDDDMRLAFLNLGWSRAANQNDAPVDFGERWGLGSKIDQALGDQLAEFYLDKYQQTKATGEPWSHEYVCHGPDVFRLYRMRILPLDEGGWLVVHTEVEEEKAPGPDTLDVDRSEFRHEDDIFRKCSHCAHFLRSKPPRRWVWAPSLIASPPAGVSHGLCPICYAYYYGDL